MAKPVKDIEGNGTLATYYHLCEQMGQVRLQLNSGDVIYLNDMREVRKIARWLNRFADSKKRKK